MANQKQYFEAKDQLLSTIMKLGKDYELDAFQLIHMLSSVTAEIADIKHKNQENEKKKEVKLSIPPTRKVPTPELKGLSWDVPDFFIGKRVQVNVGNDTWGEVIFPGVPYLVTCKVEEGYGIYPVSNDVTDDELVKSKIHKFSVRETDVEIWRSAEERFFHPQRLDMPDIDLK